MACHVQVTGGQLEQQEINAYIQRAKQKFGKEPFGIDIHVDGDYVDLSYDFGNQPGELPATWWAPWTASTTPSVPRNTTGSSTAWPEDLRPLPAGRGRKCVLPALGRFFFAGACRRAPVKRLIDSITFIVISSRTISRFLENNFKNRTSAKFSGLEKLFVIL